MAFAARKVGETSNGEGKYKYLPSYQHYQKSSLLYNYSLVKKSRTEECYLVEGFFDVISLSKLGVENCVALLGTNLSEEQIKRFVMETAAYIQAQRQKYLGDSKALSSQEKMELANYFPRPILEMARFFEMGNQKIDNPSFLSQLHEQGFNFPDLNSTAATTFRDVIVWRGTLAQEIVFHELVHVAQYQKLGLGGFADKYMRGLFNSGGYRSIPLEVQAYELSERYIKNPTQYFSVESQVDDWVAKNSY